MKISLRSLQDKTMVELFNADGKMIYKQYHHKPGNLFIPHTEKGLYFARIQNKRSVNTSGIEVK